MHNHSKKMMNKQRFDKTTILFVTYMIIIIHIIDVNLKPYD